MKLDNYLPFAVFSYGKVFTNRYTKTSQCHLKGIATVIKHSIVTELFKHLMDIKSNVCIHRL